MNRKPRTPEWKAAMSARMKGRHFSEETRAKISAAKRGKPRTPEDREAMRIGHWYARELHPERYAAKCKARSAIMVAAWERRWERDND